MCIQYHIIHIKNYGYITYNIVNVTVSEMHTCSTLTSIWQTKLTTHNTSVFSAPGWIAGIITDGAPVPVFADLNTSLI